MSIADLVRTRLLIRPSTSSGRCCRKPQAGERLASTETQIKALVGNGRFSQSHRSKEERSRGAMVLVVLWLSGPGSGLGFIRGQPVLYRNGCLRPWIRIIFAPEWLLVDIIRAGGSLRPPLPRKHGPNLQDKAIRGNA